MAAKQADAGKDHDPQGPVLDAVVVGAGFAGMYMLYKLRQQHASVCVYEAGGGVGGTWYWNRYPGARCDAESVEYSYSFCEDLQQEWEWSERYATQPEILRYAEHVAERFDLRRDIRFNTKVTSATFDDESGLWTVCTDRGDRTAARFVVMATGCLSVPRVPDMPGLSEFKGNVFHTGEWPHEPVDLGGQRVGVIGTGSSGIQIIPLLAQQAEQLYVFQRTPNFSVPARNAPLEPDFVKGVKMKYREIRELARIQGLGLHPRPQAKALETSADDRRMRYEALWQAGGATFMHAYQDLMKDVEANRTAVEFVHQKIREIVENPEVADALLPKDHPLGSKRICVDTNYYATFNRANVHLVDVRKAPIETMTAEGVRTSSADYALDAVVFATGFDAMTGALLGMDIRGRNGLRLADKWAAGPRNYLGLSIAGFPNFFMITGPGSPSVLTNVVMSIEQHVEWIANCLQHMKDSGVDFVEALSEAEEEWVQHVNELADSTLFPRANSWYVGANVPGKPRVFMPYVGGVGLYRAKCDTVVAEGYAGFLLTKRNAVAVRATSSALI